MRSAHLDTGGSGGSGGGGGSCKSMLAAAAVTGQAPPPPPLPALVAPAPFPAKRCASAASIARTELWEASPLPIAFV
ncbi:hypothetical protein XELAEV_18004456mg [Xenopus laevis]|uniref:Uncharacterized protein n=1 Tax=Xenopus laevis TaxID=8355 RepID=A0A974GYY5_XENLA|nr:hypothetical protein XELAEV_18004456mg [Xenopus laevis]